MQVSVQAPPPGPLATDGFETGNFGGGTGNWVGAWSQNNVDIQSDGPHAGNFHALVRSPSGTLNRTCDLLGISGARLSFWGRADKFKAGDSLAVKLRVDGGAPTTLTTITSVQSDDVYRFYDLDLSAFTMTLDVQIEFDSNLDKGFFYVDDVAITGFPTPPNISPISNPGPDQTVVDKDGDGFARVTLDGGASIDTDGTIVSYEWREGAMLIGTSASLSRQFEVGDHLLSLTVIDNGSASDFATLTVSVSEQPPKYQGRQWKAKASPVPSPFPKLPGRP